MPQSAHRTRFAIDHIVARQHGGRTEVENLALACLHCNSHKGPNLTGIDPVTMEITSLFNPRRQKWSDHFALSGARIEGTTAIGRATVAVLAINDADYVALRASLLAERIFPT
jgi:hypothetical protein